MTISLRPHQEQAIQMLRHSLRSGNKRPVLAAPTGAGKTIMAAFLAISAVSKGKRVLFVCDRIKLVQQSLEAMDRFGIDVGVIQGNHERTKYGAPVQIASIQTLARKQKWPDFDICIIDECFPAGTVVLTPSGPKPIELVRLGDKVYNACGVGEVTSRSVKQSDRIVEVRLSNGQKIKCTENHPFFTGTGWTEAGKLEIRQRVVSIKDMPDLWGGFQANTDKGRDSVHVGESVQQTENMLSILLEEVEKPNEQQRVKGEDAEYLNINGSQAKSYWRQWEGFNSAAKDAARVSGQGMGSGIYSVNGYEGVEGGKTSLPLQNRSSEQGACDSDRGGRIQSLLYIEAGAGFKKRSGVGEIRVESVTRIEQESSTTVYNIGVSGHPSYFADGILVHNCQTLYKAHIEMMKTYNNLPFIGLSATPYSKGLGKHFDDLIVPITTRQLQDQGYLARAKYYGGAKVNLDGVKRKALPTGGSDYDPKSLSENIEKDEKLTGDIIKNWLHHGQGRQTIAFTPSIRHSKELVRQFNEAGIGAEHIDGYMDDEERQVLYEAHDAGEFMILSCSQLLNTGYDAPQVSCLIDCYPTKSLITWVQRIGRVLRSHDDKDHAIVLDHAGNTQKLGFAEDIVPDELDDGEKRYDEKSLTKEKKESKVKECPQCHGHFVGVRCACGYEVPVKEQLDTTDEMLVELSASEKRNKTASKEAKAQFLSELMAYASIKGYSHGWAQHKYKERYSVWPNKIQPHTISSGISDEVKKFITSQNIRNAKRRTAA